MTNFNIDWDVSHRVYINYSKQASGKARVSCLIDNQLVFDLDGLVAAIGDFGLCSIRKSDVYFTNVTVKDIPNVSTDGKCYL